MKTAVADRLKRVNTNSCVFAEKAQPKMEKALLEAFGHLRGAARLGRISGDVTPFDYLVARLAKALSLFEAELKEAFTAGAEAFFFAGNVNVRVAKQDKIDAWGAIRKDIWTDGSAFTERSFKQIREITEEQRQRIGSIVRAAYAEGQSIPRTALLLRDVLGLTVTQAQAVSNYRAMLEKDPAKSLDYELRNTRFDTFVSRMVEQGKPLTLTNIDKMVDGYAQRSLAQRATTIARYETLAAANMGAFSALQSVLDTTRGKIDPDRVTKFWMLHEDEKTCPVCRTIADQNSDGVGMYEDFTWNYSTKLKAHEGSVFLPPQHPQCRCTCTYSIDGEGRP